MIAFACFQARYPFSCCSLIACPFLACQWLSSDFFLAWRLPESRFSIIEQTHSIITLLATSSLFCFLSLFIFRPLHQSSQTPITPAILCSLPTQPFALVFLTLSLIQKSILTRIRTHAYILYAQSLILRLFGTSYFDMRRRTFQLCGIPKKPSKKRLTLSLADKRIAANHNCLLSSSFCPNKSGPDRLYWPVKAIAIRFA